MINALAGAANAAADAATGFSRRIADVRWPTLTNEEGNKGIRQGGVWDPEKGVRGFVSFVHNFCA